MRKVIRLLDCRFVSRTGNRRFLVCFSHLTIKLFQVPFCVNYSIFDQSALQRSLVCPVFASSKVVLCLFNSGQIRNFLKCPGLGHDCL